MDLFNVVLKVINNAVVILGVPLERNLIVTLATS